MKTVYIISGPAGVGKSTTSKRLAEQIGQSAYIEGDVINHMVVGGYLPPWESDELLSLTWENIADLCINFLQANKNVIIDYVAFPTEVDQFQRRLSAKVSNVIMKYIVLWVDEEELLRRDALRAKEHQMGVRCLELVDELKSSGIDKRFFYHTTKLDLLDLEVILMNIRENNRFIY